MWSSPPMAERIARVVGSPNAALMSEARSSGVAPSRRVAYSTGTSAVAVMSRRIACSWTAGANPGAENVVDRMATRSTGISFGADDSAWCATISSSNQHENRNGRTHTCQRGLGAEREPLVISGGLRLLAAVPRDGRVAGDLGHVLPAIGQREQSVGVLVEPSRIRPTSRWANAPQAEVRDTGS